MQPDLLVPSLTNPSQNRRVFDPRGTTADAESVTHDRCALLEEAEKMDFREVVSGLSTENEVSRKLPCSLGFREVDTYEIDLPR